MLPDVAAQSSGMICVPPHADGTTTSLDNKQLERLLHVGAIRIRLVVFNSRDSAKQAELACHHVDVAIGMESSMGPSPSRACRTGAAEDQVLVSVDGRYKLGPRDERHPTAMVERRDRPDPGGKGRPVGDASALDLVDLNRWTVLHRCASRRQGHIHCGTRTALAQLQLDRSVAPIPAHH